MDKGGEPLSVSSLRDYFTGVIPMVFATVSAQGVPNVTYLSRALPVDDERIAISNQFMSKSQRNLAENPHASMMLVHPTKIAEYRLSLVFEQTVRRGPLFDRMRNDLAMIAALTGMQDVFRLAGADIFRVTHIEPLAINECCKEEVEAVVHFHPDHAALGELCGRLSRCSDLDTLVRVLVEGLDELLGFEHSMLLLADETGERLFTIATHGYEHQGVGSEVAVGEGVVGLAAERCAPVRADNAMQMSRYARSVREAFERVGELRPGVEIPMPGLPNPNSA